MNKLQFPIQYFIQLIYHKIHNHWMMMKKRLMTLKAFQMTWKAIQMKWQAWVW